MKKYNQPPIQLDGYYPIQVDEMMYYQYLPIKMAWDDKIYIPERLKCFTPLIDDAISDFGSKSEYNFMYITAKNMFVSPGTNLNRLGWHSDGFGTDDVSYIWCNSIPAVWTDGSPCPPSDDSLALEYFNRSENVPIYQTEVNRLYKLGQYVVHACSTSNTPQLRAFVKINFSEDKYNLLGNSHNYLIDYHWEMNPRKAERNHPQTSSK